MGIIKNFLNKYILHPSFLIINYRKDRRDLRVSNTTNTGSAEHLSEYFDNGDILLTLSQTTDDSRIKNILSSVAEYCELESEGSAEIILEWITDDDCDYIAKFLGLEPLDYEGDWTKEEEDSWESR